jgi:acyl dehydratase
MPETISLEEFARLEGTELAPSPWLEITQARVNQFADATNDHQFIHTDAERARQTPFGGTIAHGFLTLSLLSDLLAACWPVPDGLEMGLNYGSDKVRYLAPVKTGQRIRARGKILEVSEKRPGQWLLKTSVTVDIEGESAPALIAEILSMFIIGDNGKDQT